MWHTLSRTPIKMYFHLLFDMKCWNFSSDCPPPSILNILKPHTRLLLLDFITFIKSCCTVYSIQGRTGPPGCLALARWAGWSVGQVGRHVECWRREWNWSGAHGRDGFPRINHLQGPRVLYTYTPAHGAVHRPTKLVRSGLKSQSASDSVSATLRIWQLWEHHCIVCLARRVTSKIVIIIIYWDYAAVRLD